jgi:transposase InsO family protein
MEMQIDFRNDTVTAMGQTIKLESTSSGDYVIPVTTILNESSKVVLHLQDIQDLSKQQKTTKALKLHRQFSHAPANKLLKLVDKSSINDKEFRDSVKEVCDTCSFCRVYKPAPLKPVVGLPLASHFNDVVCMDLVEFEHNKKWILHLIDASSRYSTATLIHTKHKDEIVKQIFRIWIAYFGCPRKFMLDNGGEFSNDVFREMNEKLNVETITTAAESPFSNGTVERHNGILKQTMLKTIVDVKCDPNIALAWAICAKNALHNHFGFSPNQMVFGFNVNMPTVLSDEPPALESRISSDTVRINLNAIHQARVNFMRAEASEKIRRASKHKTRTYSDEQFTSGEKVYYRRNNFKGWKGPATVLGNDGKVVLVRHGGAFYRCHRCHLMKVQKSAMRSENVTDKTGQQQKKNVNFPKNPVEEFHEMDVDRLHEVPDQNQVLDFDEERSIADEAEDVQGESLEEGDADETDEGETDEGEIENSGEGNADALQGNEEDDEGNSEGEEEVEFRGSNEKPKKRSWMMLENERGEWKKASVLSLQQKEQEQTKTG